MKMDLSKLEKSKEITRYPCPFYGFDGTFGIMMDSEGNQCVLKKGYFPCQMEMLNENPNWNFCKLLNRESAKKLISKMEDSKIFPSEFFPKGATKWEGVSFKDWYNYVMKSE